MRLALAEPGLPVAALLALAVPAALLAAAGVARSPPASTASEDTTACPGLSAAAATTHDDAAEPGPADLLDRHDAIAAVVLAAEPTLDATGLRDALERHPGVSVEVEVIDLGLGERLLLWRQPPPAIHGGGARISAFVDTEEGWRQFGGIDSRSWLSSVDLVAIDRVAGAAIFVETFSGNGAPPAHIFAVGVNHWRIVVASDEVARVEVDARGAHPEVRVWRRVEELAPYPDAPIHAARWSIVRKNAELLIVETPLTPWVDALAAFCSGAHPDLAAPRPRALVERCRGRAELRWTPRGQVKATLPLALRCAGVLDSVEEGELTLAQVRGAWRVVDAAGCSAP
jgi:hypothetical protein